jgi:hypothetical protein
MSQLLRSVITCVSHVLNAQFEAMMINLKEDCMVYRQPNLQACFTMDILGTTKLLLVV